MYLIQETCSLETGTVIDQTHTPLNIAKLPTFHTWVVLMGISAVSQVSTVVIKLIVSNSLCPVYGKVDESQIN